MSDLSRNHIYDVIIIGGGPGGYTAALYASRAGLDTVVLEKFSAGGQMCQTSQIDNYPGFDEGIDGFEPANVLKYVFENGSWIAVRPSGTEPKIKTYVMAQGATAEEAENNRKAVREAIDALLAQKVPHERR